MNTIDTYLKSKNKASLEVLSEFTPHIIGPVQGTPAQVEQTDGDGITIPAVDAKGDFDYYYVCVRSLLPVPVFDDIEECEEEEGKAVVGVWA